MGLANKEPEEPLSNNPVPPAGHDQVRQPRNLIKQLLIIQLMQADGLFPISDALQGVTQHDIIRLICGTIGAEQAEVEEALQQSAAILLKKRD